MATGTPAEPSPGVTRSPESVCLFEVSHVGAPLRSAIVVALQAEVGNEEGERARARRALRDSDALRDLCLVFAHNLFCVLHVASSN
jgi:hypothetical protein